MSIFKREDLPMLTRDDVTTTPVLGLTADDNGNCNGFELWFGVGEAKINYEFTHSDVMMAKKDLQTVCEVNGASIMCSSSIDHPEELNLHPNFDLLTYIANTHSDPYMFLIPEGAVPGEERLLDTIMGGNPCLDIPAPTFDGGRRPPSARTKGNVVAVDFGIKVRL